MRAVIASYARIIPNYGLREQIEREREREREREGEREREREREREN